jgi:hypothetical protein
MDGRSRDRDGTSRGTFIGRPKVCGDHVAGVGHSGQGKTMCGREHMPAADQRASAQGVISDLTVHGGEVHGEIDHPGHLANVTVRTTGKL